MQGCRDEWHAMQGKKRLQRSSRSHECLRVAMEIVPVGCRFLDVMLTNLRAGTMASKCVHESTREIDLVNFCRERLLERRWGNGLIHCLGFPSLLAVIFAIARNRNHT